MKILVLGGSGMLGHKLVQAWHSKFEVYTALKSRLNDYVKYGIFERKRTFEKVSAENFETVENVIKKVSPEVIVNAVGIVKQQKNANDVIKMLTVNSIFPHRLAESAEKHRARLINISTDCVFDGKKGNYTEEDRADASDLYGMSKYLGEVQGENCLTLRTSIIGRELKTDHGLVEWFLQNRGEKVRGYVNAVFTGFPTVVLADIIADLIIDQKDLHGLYHLSSEPISKFDLLHLINTAFDAQTEIEPFEDFYIDRSLSSDRLRQKTGFQPPGWTEMIGRMAADPAPYDLWRK